jgi:superfamily I DNA/RNA helicase
LLIVFVTIFENVAVLVNVEITGAKPGISFSIDSERSVLLTAHTWRPLAERTYDFVVIDEVQDFTIAQLALILATLKNSAHFLLYGDAHQIVHPNFFSLAAVRALLWLDAAGDDISSGKMAVLRANFRNTKTVTEIASGLPKIKQASFG